MTTKKIIIVSLVLFVSAIPVLAQDIHEAAKIGDLEQLKKILGKKSSKHKFEKSWWRDSFTCGML